MPLIGRLVTPVSVAILNDGNVMEVSLDDGRVEEGFFCLVKLEFDLNTKLDSVGEFDWSDGTGELGAVSPIRDGEVSVEVSSSGESSKDIHL